MKKLLLTALFVFIATPVAWAADKDKEEGFVPLFDGKTLEGWHQVIGPATYIVEDGCIVGEKGEGRPNSFLCTKKNYADFILKLQLKFDELGNSGTQIRSHQKPEGNVFGYQVEVDPWGRAWSGGIYDEGRRGWLYPLKGDEHAEARKAFKPKEWNEFVIKANGPLIQTWVNGVPVAKLYDVLDADGLIGLQVHWGKIGKIRWKNIRIKELNKEKPLAWKPIFDGKTLDGWKQQGPGNWKVEEGAMHGTSDGPKDHGLLCTEKEYDDFALRLKFKAVRGDSGVYFRSELTDHVVGIKGFQAQVDVTGKIAGLYETLGRKWVQAPDPELVKKNFKQGEWNEMVIICKGGDVTTFVNGRQMCQLLDDDKGRTKGIIAFQMHGGEPMDVWYKDVEIMELPKEEK